MKGSVIHGILILFIMFCLTSPALAESIGTVYLKNGASMRGAIVELIPEESISLTANDDQLYKFPFEDVDMITVEVASYEPIRFLLYLKDGQTAFGELTEMIPGESVRIKTDESDFSTYPLDEIAQLKIFNVATQEKWAGTQKDSRKDSFMRNLLTPGKGGLLALEHKGSRKSPGMAVLLSSILPGGGQFYNGQPAKGFIFLGVETFGVLLAITEATKETRHQLGDEEKGGSRKNFVIGYGMAIGGWFVSIVDAYISAKIVNKRMGYSFFEFPIKKDVALSFSPTINSEIEFEPRLMLRCRF